LEVVIISSQRTVIHHHHANNYSSMLLCQKSTVETPVQTRDLSLDKNNQQEDTPTTTTLVNSPSYKLTPVGGLFSSDDSKDVIFLFTPKTDIEDWHELINNVCSKNTNRAKPNCQEEVEEEGNDTATAPIVGDSQEVFTTTDHDVLTVRSVTVPPERRNSPKTHQ
jgi:hypothetical protein